ncbi:MAG: aldo/keto reductase [Chloroflexi bacterium]|nr:aldo/keto reductase [Chloroflexota bacterium]
MEKRRLGKSEIEITPIGMGCWQFANSGNGITSYWDEQPQEQIDRIVAASIAGGVNWFDTAEAYGKGKSENSLTTGLQTLGVKPNEVVIATKWQPIFRTARSLIETIDERLQALNGYPIDLHQIHHAFSFSSIEKQMMSMVELLRQGKIRSAGVSNFNANQMRKAHAILQREGFPLVSNQVLYNLLNRNIENNGVLETARELGITIIAFSPLAQGILTGKYHQNPDEIQTHPGPRKYLKAFQIKSLEETLPLIREMQSIAEAYGVTPAQIALNWLIRANGDLVVAIPGASRVQQAEDNANAANFRLTQKEMEKLEEVSTRLNQA